MVKKQSIKIGLKKENLMKHWLIILFICIFTQITYAQESSGGGGKFGLGLSLFGPTGITGKYLVDDKLAFEGSLGFGSFGNGRFHLHGVVNYNFYKISDSISVYTGGGLVLQERGYRNGNGRGRGNVFNFFNREREYETSLGLRAPIGLSWRNADRKFELAAELHLNLFLTGRDGADLGLALAGRYYF